MKTVVNQLGAELSVTPRIKDAKDLRVTLTLTNESDRPMRLNATYLTAPSLVLKFFDERNQPVPTGPPPVPDPDDGSGRVTLEPRRPITHVFEGANIFYYKLPPGKYSVSFLFMNDMAPPGEWAGTIKTPGVDFVVDR